MIIIEINNQVKARISQKFVEDVIKKVFKRLNIKKARVSIALVDEKAIKQLNKCYRGKNEVTDVLSFETGKSKKFIGAPVDRDSRSPIGVGDKLRGNDILGEIIICYPRAKKQAKEFEHSVKEELRVLLSHSLLHLLGYSHKEMDILSLNG